MRQNFEHSSDWGLETSPEQQAAEEETRLNRYMARSTAEAEKWILAAEAAELEETPAFDADAIQKRLETGRAYTNDKLAYPENPGDDLAVLMALLEKLNEKLTLRELHDMAVNQLRKQGKSVLPPRIRMKTTQVDPTSAAVRAQFKKSEEENRRRIARA